MLARRELFATTFGGVLGDRAWGPSPSAPDQSSQTSDRQVMEIVDALKEIRKALEIPQSFIEIAGIRQKQLDYLKATNKFPDFIDVGSDVWFGVHDWHIKHLQPPVLGRDAGGRYTIALMATQIVLRHDLAPAFISAPYDNR